MGSLKRTTQELLDEAMVKQREVKGDLLDIMTRITSTQMSNQKIADELFKIFVKVK